MLAGLKNHIDKNWPSAKTGAIDLALATGAGSLVTLSDPRGLAIGLIAQKIFAKSSIALMGKGLDKAFGKPLTNKKFTCYILGTISAVNTGLFVGRKVARLTGYSASIWAMLAGHAVVAVGFMIKNIASIKKNNVDLSSLSKEEGLSTGNHVVEITQENFQKEVEESNIPVILDCYTPWCGPCKMIAPIFNNLGGEMAGQVKFGKINADNEAALAQKFNIFAMPTFLFFKEGKVINKHVGLLDKDGFIEKIQEHFRS